MLLCLLLFKETEGRHQNFTDAGRAEKVNGVRWKSGREMKGGFPEIELQRASCLNRQRLKACSTAIGAPILDMLLCGSICRFSVPGWLTRSDAWLSIYARLFCGARTSLYQGGTCMMS